MPNPNPDLIPTRRPIDNKTVDRIAQSEYDRLIAGWGLANVRKISNALNKKVKAEAKRRKGMK